MASIGLAIVASTAAPALAASGSAAIVIDARSGRTLYESNADAMRYPASLTKMMTLYLTFEALASGRIAKSTPVPFSAFASSQPPTKLGVKPGNSVAVETAILALVTRSANDAATALGEMLAGSQPNFARLMTAKARKLGMSKTTFRNAHGLPDAAQKTTARDMALLGIALREHFPQYFSYFSTRSFTYGRHRISNHNHLLGRVEGVDGIKTGYTRASGFNLVSSVRRDGRSIVAVVMGGRTARSRDAQMVALINKYLPRASRSGDGGDLVASRKAVEAVKLASAVVLPREDAPVPDRRPTPASAQVASAGGALALVQEAPTPAARPLDSLAVPTPPEPIDPVSTASTASSGWAIQVASAPSEQDARAVLDRTARQAPAVLADASPFTAVFEKDGSTYYRARFGGFSSKSDAWNACGALKKKKIACYAIAR